MVHATLVRMHVFLTLSSGGLKTDFLVSLFPGLSLSFFSLVYLSLFPGLSLYLPFHLSRFTFFSHSSIYFYLKK